MVAETEIDMRKRIAVDLDGTLTLHGQFPDFHSQTMDELHKFYKTVKPNLEVIKKVNEMFDKGFIIYIYTSRYDMFQHQIKHWLQDNGIKHHYLICNKPYYDFIVDDKAVTPEEFVKW